MAKKSYIPGAVISLIGLALIAFALFASGAGCPGTICSAVVLGFKAVVLLGGFVTLFAGVLNLIIPPIDFKFRWSKVIAFVVGWILIFLSPDGIATAGVGFLWTTVPGVGLVVWSLTNIWNPPMLNW